MDSVLITGASSGIGRDAALYFNELGWRVFAGVRRREDGERVRSESTRPELFHPLRMDVTDADQIEAAAATVTETVGPAGLTALVSNAGIAALTAPASCEQCPLHTQQTVMDINFFGAVRVVQAFLPLLRRSKGTVVFNTALMARTVIPFNGGYAASKWALEGWADTLRREVQPLGVRVAMIEAGYISSELENKQHPSPVVDTEPVYPLENGLLAAISGSAKTMGDRPSASPRRMSEAMVAVVTAARPRPRTIVGTGSRAIWTVGGLPDRLQDRIFRLAIPRLVHRAQRSLVTTG